MSRFIMGKKQLGGITSSRSSTPSASRSAPPPPPPTLDGDRRIGEFSSLDDVCPVCKSDRYLKPNLRLMVSFCYHKMCGVSLGACGELTRNAGVRAVSTGSSRWDRNRVRAVELRSGRLSSGHRSLRTWGCRRRSRSGRGRPRCESSSLVWNEGSELIVRTHSFNKRQEDFKDLKSYNDYLETFEDLSPFPSSPHPSSHSLPPARSIQPNQ